MKPPRYNIKWVKMTFWESIKFWLTQRVWKREKEVYVLIDPNSPEYENAHYQASIFGEPTIFSDNS